MTVNASIMSARKLGYPYPSSPAVTAVMKGNRRAGTRPELAVRRLIHARGLRYRVDYLIQAGEVRVRPDVVFTRQRVVLFVDGCFWHGCPKHGGQPRVNMGYWQAKIGRNRARDERVDRALRQHGWTVIRAWEHELPSVVTRRVARAVRQRTHVP